MVRFPPQFLDEIRARLPVSVVVGRRVKLKKAGREWKGLSPFTQEKTPSFYVNDAKGFYHCFSSGKHGDIISFVIETEGLTFPEAVERLAGEAGVPMPKMENNRSPEQLDRYDQLYKVLAAAQAYFRLKLQASEGRKARDYLVSRGTAPSLIETFGLGYAPADRFGLRDHLAGLGFVLDVMLEAGLVIMPDDGTVAYDRFRDRLMFPIEDMKGRVVAFGGRALSSDAQAKYLNSPETTLFHKGRMVFNGQRARAAAHKAGTVVVVEGYFDVVAMHGAGIAHSIAPLGTALTEDQLQLLWRMGSEPILCFDGDKAGLRAAYRALDVALPFLTAEHTLRFAFLPDGQDPDDLVRSQGAAALHNVLAQSMPLIDVLWRRETEGQTFSTPEQRAAFEGKLKHIGRAIADPALRPHYEAELSNRMRALFRGGASSGASRESGGYVYGQGSSGRGVRGGAGYGRGFVREEPLRLPILSQAGSGLKSREVAIVLAVVNHPELLQYAERLAALSLSHPALRSLMGCLLDLAGRSELGSASSLREALIEEDQSEALVMAEKALLSAEWWVGPQANFADVETAWFNALDLHEHQQASLEELKQIEFLLAEEPSDENMARLRDIKARLAQLEGHGMNLEGFGVQSLRTKR
jgi:DNA primase